MSARAHRVVFGGVLPALLWLSACSSSDEPSSWGSPTSHDAAVPEGGADTGADTGGADTGADASGNDDVLPLDDADGDGIADGEDNCVNDANPSQWDTDGDAEGDACELQDGTFEHPFLIPGDPLLPDYRDARSTADATSSVVDSYPGHDGVDESGPEFVYMFALEARTEVVAFLGPEPDGTDVDLHLLSSVNPLQLEARDDQRVSAVLEPGVYYLVADTYAGGGTAQQGPYDLTVALEGLHAGTLDDPLLPGEDPNGALSLPFVYLDARDTTAAPSDAFDVYPGYESLDESGPEYIYLLLSYTDHPKGPAKDRTRCSA